MPVHYKQDYCAFITLDRPGGGAASRPKVYHQLMLLLLLTSFLREGRELGILMRGAGKHSFYYSTPSASLDVLLLILIHKGRGQVGKQRTH